MAIDDQFTLHGRSIDLPDDRIVEGYLHPDGGFVFKFQNEGRTKVMRLTHEAAAAMFQIASELINEKKEGER